MSRRGTKFVLLLGGSAMAVAAAVSAPVTARADAATCSAMTAPAYQRVNPDTKANFLSTSSTAAADAADDGFTQNEGTPFRVAKSSGDGLRPVHKLYRATSGDNLYTISQGEIDSATARGKYVDQGVSFYATTADEDCGIPVYRVRGFGQHRLVVGAGDRDALLDDGWKDEGVAFYGAGTAPVSSPAQPVTDTKFSIAVMPDTQQEVLRASDRRFENRTQWLADNESSLDLRFVAHSGDVVNWDTPDHSQYKIASKAMKPLEDADIPYSLAIGNHDTAAVCEGGAACDVTKTSTLFRDTSTFNDYFSASRFGAVKGSYESGKVDNTYSTISAGGVKWLFLTLEMWPRPGALSWAKGVVESHQDYNVVLITHSYLDESGDIAQANVGSGKTSPQALFDGLIKQYPNIKLVFSGHVGGRASRTDTGVEGNKIYSFLQTFHDNRTNPVRLMTIDTKANTLKTWIYSPYTDEVSSGSEINISGLSLVR